MKDYQRGKWGKTKGGKKASNIPWLKTKVDEDAIRSPRGGWT